MDSPCKRRVDLVRHTGWDATMNEFDDPFGVHRLSKPTGRVDKDGREIRVLGRPILAWNAATNNLTLPDDCRDHPFVLDRYFYTLPSKVIELVVESVGGERFDNGLLDLERRLSAINGDHTCNVGFWHETAIPYRELRSLPIPDFADELIHAAGMTPAQVDHALQAYQNRDLPLLESFSKSYCGWLMTNRTFLDEHDALLARHAETVSRWGTQHATYLLPADYRVNLLPGSDPHEDPLWAEFVKDASPFLVRWRLSGLAGPYLPAPAKPFFAGTFPISVVQQLAECGGVFFLPDTMPIPSRDQLRGMLDDALHRRENVEHVAKWLDIVRSDNVAKNKMTPFMRYFELQHYWRFLNRRHASAIYRKTGKLEEAFGRVFEVSPRKIHLDMIEIRKRLGSDWLDRPCPLEKHDAESPSTRKPR